MQRWEYKVVSFKDGRYTEPLNEHGRSGWELVTVVEDRPPPAAGKKGMGLPMPRTLERIEDAASKLTPQEEPAGPALLWVLRRELPDE